AMPGAMNESTPRRRTCRIRRCYVSSLVVALGLPEGQLSAVSDGDVDHDAVLVEAGLPGEALSVAHERQVAQRELVVPVAQHDPAMIIDVVEAAPAVLAH